jgi:hypothetical protein
LIGQGIFHGDQDFFISKFPECNEGQFRDQKSPDLHEKSLDLSSYEIFQHKILKSQSFKKRAVYCYFYATLNIFSYTGDNLEMKNPLTYQIIDNKLLNVENAPKLLKKISQNMKMRVLTKRT